MNDNTIFYIIVVCIIILFISKLIKKSQSQDSEHTNEPDNHTNKYLGILVICGICIYMYLHHSSHSPVSNVLQIGGFSNHSSTLSNIEQCSKILDDIL